MKKEKEVEYEEVEVKCTGCGRKMWVIRRRGHSSESALCQKCGFGEGLGEDSD